MNKNNVLHTINLFLSEPLGEALVKVEHELVSFHLVIFLAGE